MDTKATIASLLIDLRQLAGERRTGDLIAQISALRGSASHELRRELDGLMAIVRWHCAAIEGRFDEGLPEAVRYVERLRNWEIEAPIDWVMAAAGFAMGVAGRLEQGLSWVFAARDMASASKDDATLLSILTSKAALYSLSGDYQAADRVFASARRVNSPKVVPRIVLLNNQAFSLVSWARSLSPQEPKKAPLAQRAMRCAEEAISLATPTLGPRWLAWGTANRAHALALLGRRDEAEKAYREAIPLAAANLRVEVTALAGLAQLLIDAARLEEAEALLRTAHDKAPASLLDTTMDLVLDAWVRLETKSGRAEEVARWSARRLQRIEEQYRTRLANVLRHAQLLETLERERLLERQRAEAALEATRAQAREALLQDLHDGFGSNLATARIRAARGELSQASLVEILDECISDLYLVVDSISNTEGNLGEALRLLRNRLEGRLYGEATSIRWRIALESLPPLGHTRMNQVLRIVQEALANTFKHARASHAWIDASLTDDGLLSVTVGDNGVGIADSPANGNGLQGMRSRALGLGATLSIGRRDPGTVVGLLVPV